MSGGKANSRPRGRLGSAALVCAALWTALALPGCGGCSATVPPNNPQAAKGDDPAAKKPPPKPKPDFEPLRLSALPFEPREQSSQEIAVRPGHWVSVEAQTKTNNFDFSGRLNAAAVTSQLNPIDLPMTLYRLETSRPAVLPKGQPKTLELTFFNQRDATNSMLLLKLTDRTGTREIARPPATKLVAMPAHQYQFVVLAASPDRYTYLNRLYCVRSIASSLKVARENAEFPHLFQYQVVRPKIGERVPLPGNPLVWTGIGYLLWDDVHPKLFSPDQQAALVDWLHWGGQVIVSGPKTLETLQGSFLNDYLPATSGGPRELAATDFASLNQQWGHSGGNAVPLAPPRPLVGIRLVPHAAAAALPGTGGLIVERRVGRGRIVATAFRLSEKAIYTWPSFDSLVNACLLRRGAREFAEQRAAGPIETQEVIARWQGEPEERLFDPRLVTSLRYFSRDTGFQPGPWRAPEEPIDPEQSNSPPGMVPPRFYVRPGFVLESLPDPEFVRGQVSLGQWNDANTVSNRAREALKHTAGVEVPHRRFVLAVVLGYLVVLVPLNWLVFRVLGRTELAWIAVPIIALGFAAGVVHMAQLDIGFVRSKTEISVVEAHAGHPRAMVTRYTALYTSLSTSYELEFDDPTALSLPLGDPKFREIPGQGRSDVLLRSDAGVKLSGFKVMSNSTAMLHSEHMLSCGGTLELKDLDTAYPKLKNGTRLRLSGAGVLRWQESSEGKPDPRWAWIGQLAAGGEAMLTFLRDPRHWQDSRASAIARSSADPRHLAQLGKLIELAEAPDDVRPGDARLVAWCEEELPGVSITPAASQKRQLSLVVAHLRFGALPAPRRDPKLPPEVVTADLDAELPSQPPEFGPD